MGTCSCKQGTCQLAAGSLSAVFTHSFCKLRSYTDLLYVNKVQGTCQLAAGSLSAVSTHSVCKLRSHTDLGYRSLLCAWWLHGNACFVNKILANLLSAPVCPQFVPHCPLFVPIPSSYCDHALSPVCAQSVPSLSPRCPLLVPMVSGHRDPRCPQCVPNLSPFCPQFVPTLLCLPP